MKSDESSSPPATQVVTDAVFVRDEVTVLSYAALGCYTFWLYAFGPAVTLLRDELGFSYTLLGLYSVFWSLGAALAGAAFTWVAYAGGDHLTLRFESLQRLVDQNGKNQPLQGIDALKQGEFTRHPAAHLVKGGRVFGFAYKNGWTCHVSQGFHPCMTVFYLAQQFRLKRFTYSSSEFFTSAT